MGLGYETYDDTRDFEKKGLTGEVKRYTAEKNMKYPNVVVKLSPTVSKYKINILKSMFVASDKVSLEDETISIYFDAGEKLVKFGRLYSSQIKAFLKLFDTEEITGYLDKDTELNGMYLYTLVG